MADLRTDFAGIKSPNPFWLASGPPTDKEYNVVRAFEAGWGGVVWKTVGDPIINTASRYGARDFNQARLAGFTNIELISDRPIEVNLREVKQVKRDWPDRAVVVSMMVPCAASRRGPGLSTIGDVDRPGSRLRSAEARGARHGQLGQPDIRRAGGHGL